MVYLHILVKPRVSHRFPVHKLFIFKPESNFLLCCFHRITPMTDVPKGMKLFQKIHAVKRLNSLKLYQEVLIWVRSS